MPHFFLCLQKIHISLYKCTISSSIYYAIQIKQRRSWTCSGKKISPGYPGLRSLYSLRLSSMRSSVLISSDEMILITKSLGSENPPRTHFPMTAMQPWAR